jgi:hypothetical protein
MSYSIKNVSGGDIAINSSVIHAGGSLSIAAADAISVSKREDLRGQISSGGVAVVDLASNELTSTDAHAYLDRVINGLIVVS